VSGKITGKWDSAVYYKDPLAQTNLTLEGYYNLIYGLSAKWNMKNY